jgi:hypothetical protein
MSLTLNQANRVIRAPLAKTAKLNIKVIAAISIAFVSLAPSALAQDAWSEGGGPGRYVPLPFLLNEGVLDQETDLVWEQTPSNTPVTWQQAQNHCNSLVVGNRMGWRFPTIQELTSLLGRSVPPPAYLSPPFTFRSNWSIGAAIWSATTSAAVATQAWTMNLAGSVPTITKTALGLVWCVRFRQGVNPQ